MYVYTIDMYIAFKVSAVISRTWSKLIYLQAACDASIARTTYGLYMSSCRMCAPFLGAPERKLFYLASIGLSMFGNNMKIDSDPNLGNTFH